MTPTDQQRETARIIKIGICACSVQPPYTCTQHEAIATALTNLEAEGVARGRGEAAEIARRKLAEYEKAEAAAFDNAPDDAIYYNGKGTAAIEIADAILASSPGPSLGKKETSIEYCGWSWNGPGGVGQTSCNRPTMPPQGVKFCYNCGNPMIV